VRRAPRERQRTAACPRQALTADRPPAALPTFDLRPWSGREGYRRPANAGGNLGWPNVLGFRNDLTYAYANFLGGAKFAKSNVKRKLQEPGFLVSLRPDWVVATV